MPLSMLTPWIELVFSLSATPIVLLYLYALLTSALNYGIKTVLTANGLGLLFLTTSHVAVAVCRMIERKELGEDAVANLALFLHQIAYNCCNVSQLLITMERMVIGRFPRLYVNAHVSQPLIIGICVLAQVFITLPCTMLVQDGPEVNGHKLYTASVLTQKISVVLSASITTASLLMVVVSFTQSRQRYNKAFFKSTLDTRHQVREVIVLTRVLIPVCCTSVLLKFAVSTLAFFSYGNVRNLDHLFTAIRFCCTASAVIEPVLLLSRHRLLRKRLAKLFGRVEGKIHPTVIRDPVTIADVYFGAFNNDLNRRTTQFMMNGTHLQYYFEWDRDLLLRLCATIREVFWPISVFFIHPLVLFVLIRRTKMDLDCKVAFVVHDVFEILFDIYNGHFYQFYTLIPYPIFCCTGVLCDARTSHRMLLTVLAFLTIAQCVPYIFVMMRLHQKMVPVDSRAKLSQRSQLLLMCLFMAVLVSNVYGFGAWSAESPDSVEILNIPDIAWVKNRTANFLVFGRKYGDIGLFDREMYLLLCSILVCFGFYSGCTCHAIVIGKKNARALKSSKTIEIQLRFMMSMAIQACLTSLFFVTPLVILGISMATPIAHLIPAAMLPGFRIVLVVVYCCCSFGHSIVFLGKSAYIIQKIRNLASSNMPKTSAMPIGPPLTQRRKSTSY